MKSHRLHTTLALWGLTMMLLWGQAMAASTTLQFETQALDLETGTVSEEVMLATVVDTGADVRIAYNADRIPHAVVVGADPVVGVVILVGVAFDSVTSDDLASLDFSAPAPDVPLGSADTVVVRTTDGAVFKLGNMVESETGVSLDYLQLQ